MEKKLISIIIPAYNVDKYLGRCLDSIVCQDISKIEILIINDGSTDNTLNVAKEYRLKYDHIRIINQYNQGVSKSRNNGIKAAFGEYIFFVDADDTLCSCALTKIVENISSKKTDALMINYFVSNDKGDVIPKSSLRFFEEDFPKRSISGQEALRLLFEMKISHWSWELICKRIIYFENVVEFPNGQRYGEDFATTFKLLFFSKSVSFVHEYIYNYLQRNGSAMHTPRISDATDYLRTVNSIDRFVDKNIPEFRELSIRYELPRLINAYSITCKESSKDVEVKLKRTKIRNLLLLKSKIVKKNNNLSFRDKVKLLLIKIEILPIIYRIYYRKD